jgi:hypothetical protein
MYCRFNSTSLANDALDALFTAPGIGTTCMSEAPALAPFTACRFSDEQNFSQNYTV